ncbi:GRIM-19 protein, partial [Rhizoctonia solani]
MPPPGGFEAIKYKRSLPFRGPSGAVLLGGIAAVCAYGFYKVGKGNLERRRLWALVLRFKMPGSYEPELSVILTSYTRDGGRRLSAPDSRVLDTLSNDTARTKEETGELKRENTWARIYLVPLLLAEGDRDAYRREQASLAREREIMKDVKGWERGDRALSMTQLGDDQVRLAE